jgi:hypothetical protein
MTLSYCGDDEAGQAHFPRIRGRHWRRAVEGSGGLADQMIEHIDKPPNSATWPVSIKGNSEVDSHQISDLFLRSRNSSSTVVTQCQLHHFRAPEPLPLPPLR